MEEIMDDYDEFFHGVMARMAMTLIQALAAVGVVWLLFSLVGCRTKYVGVPEVHEQYVWKRDTVWRHDSVMRRDSMWMELRGETVYVTKCKEKEVWKKIYQTRIDSFVKRDTIRVPYPVEKELSMIDKMRVCWDILGKILLLLISLCFIYFFIRFVKWLRARSNI